MPLTVMCLVSKVQIKWLLVGAVVDWKSTGGLVVVVEQKSGGGLVVERKR